MAAVLRPGPSSKVSATVLALPGGAPPVTEGAAPVADGAAPVAAVGRPALDPGVAAAR